MNPTETLPSPAQGDPPPPSPTPPPPAVPTPTTPATPSPRNTSPRAIAASSSKRKKLLGGGAEHAAPTAAESEEKYARIQAAGLPTALEHIRGQDAVIAELRASLARAEANAITARADHKSVLGALDLIAASVRDVKAAVQVPVAPALAASPAKSAPRLPVAAVPSAATFDFQPSRTFSSSVAAVAARPAPTRSTQEPVAPGFGRASPAAVALAAAVQRKRPAPADALRAAVRSPASGVRSQLGKDDFALIHIRNLRRMTPGAVRDTCAALGVDIAHVHDVGRIGPVTELVVSKSHRDEIAALLSAVPDAAVPELALQLDLAFDASKPLLADANAEMVERVRADFNSRMREQQSRCAGLGWAGLANFFAGRVDTAATRRALSSTPQQSDASITGSRQDGAHHFSAAETEAAASSSDAASRSAMEGIESPSGAATAPGSAGSGNGAASALPKFFSARQWLSEGTDLVGVLESWYLHHHLYASDPSFLVASEPPPAFNSSSGSGAGRLHDGILVLASGRLRNSIISISRSSFFVRLVLPGLIIAFVYAPPRLSDSDFLQIFRELEDCDVILGDLNVRLGPLLGSSSAARPFGRYHSLAVWMACAGFSALPPSPASSASSRWDHVLVRSELWSTLDSSLLISPSTSVGIASDHPLLQLRFPLAAPEAPDPAPDSGLHRIHLGRLHKPGAWARLQAAYGAISADVDARLATAEAAVATRMDERTRQEVIDAVDAVLHEAVLAAGFTCL
ncbi:hypothetical protein OC835_007592, partial [Tilletia horrida]